MNEALTALQQAIYNQLNNDSTLSAKIIGIYDFVPEGTEYPYISLQQNTVSDWSTVVNTGYSVNISINIYSNNRGSKEIIEIADIIHNLLHHVNLTLSNGYKLASLKYQNSQLQRSNDGLIFISKNNFTALVE